MEGYILLQRKIFDWEWWSDINTYRLWTVILLLANHDERTWHGIKVGRGQLITSYKSLSEKSGLSVQSVRTSINRLKSTGEITCKPTNKFTLITIEKYDEYQDIKNRYNKQDNTQSNNQSTNNQQASNNQSTTNKTHKALNTQKAIIDKEKRKDLDMRTVDEIVEDFWRRREL